MIICSLTECELLLEVLKRVEPVRSMELLVIFSVAALNFSIMSWCIGLNQFVANTELFQRVLKEGVFRILGIGQSVCKLTTDPSGHTQSHKETAVHSA